MLPVLHVYCTCQPTIHVCDWLTMFDFIRKHQRVVLFILLILILPSFVLLGVEGYARGDDNAVAKVAGTTITKEELDEAQRRQLDRMRQMLGDQFDARLFDTAETRERLLNELVAQRALAAEVVRAKLSVPTELLQEQIASIPGLTKEDGSFDKEQYRQLLAMQGMTPAMFQASLAHDMAVQQISSALQLSAFSPRSVATMVSDANDQMRTIQQMDFELKSFAPQVKVTEEMLQAFYDKHKDLFLVPEHASAQYVVLDGKAVESQITVTDDDLKAYYQQNIARFSTPEERRASHILILAESDSDKAKAKEKADALYAQLQTNPGDFAKLAKENSQDPVSANAGGDLGNFGRGVMVKAFEDTAFSLEEGKISAPVLSEFGYHIIKVTGIKASVAKPFEAVKASITAEVKKQLLDKRFNDMAEQFNNLVYEQGSSLEPVAKALNLTIQTVDNLQAVPQAASGAAPYNNARFLEALFSHDAVANKHNTEAIEVAPNTLVAGRIVTHIPAKTRALDEVRNAIRTRVAAEQEMVLAKAAGEAALAKLRKQDNAAGFGAQRAVSRLVPGNVDPAGFVAVMRADVSKLPAYVGVDVPGKGYSIYRISAVTQPEKKDEARRATESERVRELLTQQEMVAYIALLKERADTKILHAGKVATAAN